METDSTVEATLNAWHAQLAQVRQRRLERGGGYAGLASPQQTQGKTGLQVMTALLDGDLPHPYMADTFGCDLVELGDGLAIFQATPQLKHYNPLGSVHGGWYATLLDFALGCAVQTKLPAGRSYSLGQRRAARLAGQLRRRPITRYGGGRPIRRNRDRSAREPPPRRAVCAAAVGRGTARHTRVTAARRRPGYRRSIRNAAKKRPSTSCASSGSTFATYWSGRTTTIAPCSRSMPRRSKMSGPHLGSGANAFS